MKPRSHHRKAPPAPRKRPVGRPPKYGEHVSQPWHAAYLEERLRAGMYA